MTLKEQVENTLRRYPETRNCDTLLKLKIWELFHKEDYAAIDGELPFSARVNLHRGLPEKEAVKRYRAQIQNDEGKYLPTSWKVAKARGFKENEWRAKLGYPTKREVEDPAQLEKSNNPTLV